MGRRRARGRGRLRARTRTRCRRASTCVIKLPGALSDEQVEAPAGDRGQVPGPPRADGRGGDQRPVVERSPRERRVRDPAADRRRAGGRDRRLRSTSRTPTRRRRLASVGAALAEQVDAAIAAAREAAARGRATPAVERGGDAARGRDAPARANRRARPGDDARGRQAAGRELRRGRLDRRRVRLLRRDRPQLRRPRDPADRVDPARARAEGADRRGRLHRALELPAAAARLEARARAGRRQHDRLQALRADAALDPDAGAAASSTCRPGVVNLLAGAGDVGEAIVRDERVDCVAFTGSVETGKRVAVACAERVARVNLEMGGKDPFIVCADVADEIDVAARGGAWAAYLNAGQVCTSAERFYVMDEVYDDYVREFVDYTESPRARRPARPAAPTSARWSPARQRDKVAAQVEAAVAAGAELVTGGGDGGAGARPLLLPRGRHRRRRRDGPAARGDLRPGRADRAGARASTRRSSWRTRRATAWAATSTRATSRRSCAACARSRRARSGSTTR